MGGELGEEHARAEAHDYDGAWLRRLEVGGFHVKRESRGYSPVICPGVSVRGRAICRVCDSRNDYGLRRAERRHDAARLCCGPALIVHRFRITARRHPAFVMPSRATLPMHKPPLDSFETESLSLLVLPPFPKPPSLVPSSFP